jgi:hypothetical protein
MSKVCHTCGSFINQTNECQAYMATLIYIYNEKEQTLPQTLTVRVAGFDTCARWSERDEGQTQT